LLSGFFGYQEAPTVGEVALYLAFLIPVLSIFYSSSKPLAKPRPA
jgi:high-affinity iron transporter